MEENNAAGQEPANDGVKGPEFWSKYGKLKNMFISELDNLLPNITEKRMDEILKKPKLVRTTVAMTMSNPRIILGASLSVVSQKTDETMPQTDDDPSGN